MQHRLPDVCKIYQRTLVFSDHLYEIFHLNFIAYVGPAQSRELSRSIFRILDVLLLSSGNDKKTKYFLDFYHNRFGLDYIEGWIFHAITESFMKTMSCYFREDWTDDIQSSFICFFDKIWMFCCQFSETIRDRLLFEEHSFLYCFDRNGKERSMTSLSSFFQAEQNSVGW
ncbi:MAG: hypothetical protein H6618_10420 [Deltaproteobacteria bacterium]|nr:hypothetical protein [Deltaproteobacteria bacterium]